MDSKSIQINTQKLENDCREIHATWNQLNLLSQALACRTVSERRRIKEVYRIMYGEDILERIHRTSITNKKNEMCSALYLWMLEPHERDALLAREAVECSITDYRALLEIYTRPKPNQLFFTKQSYLTKFKSNLAQDIISESEPFSPFQKILVALAASNNSHQVEVSKCMAKSDAKRLYEAGSCSAGAVDESVILEIFSKRSIPQVKLALCSYKHIYGHEYTKRLKRENSGELEESIRAAIKLIKNPFKYYAKMVQKSLEMLGTDKRVLTRAMLGSKDAGMKEVRSAFEDKYGRKIHVVMKESLPDGDFRDFIVALACAQDCPNP